MTDTNRQGSQGYRGQERRRHTLYVTKNTEYHVRDGVCIAVKSRVKGTWTLNHSTLNRAVTSAVRFSAGDPCPSLEPAAIGDALFFGDGGSDIVTSRLLEITRPAKQVVEAYPI